MSQEKKADKPNRNRADEGLALGIGTGVALGTALGLALDNLGAGMALGAALGAGIGTVMKRVKPANQDEAGRDAKEDSN